MNRVPVRLVRSLMLLAIGARGVSTATAQHSSTPTAADQQPLIVFQSIASDDSGRDGIFLMRMDGSNVVEIGGDLDGSHNHPDWSPDGNHVVFEVLHGEAGSLWTLQVDGSAPELLLRCEAPCFRLEYPAWSPDGTKIAFTRLENLDDAEGPPDASVIQVLDVVTTAVITVTRSEFPVLIDGPRWSPDGQAIVVGVENIDSAGNDLGSAIAIVPAAGGELQYLTDFDTFAYYPDWSWTTDSIVFSTETLQFTASPLPGSDTWNSFTIKSDGSGLRQITNVPEGLRLWQPSWTPDGEHIIATLDTPSKRDAVLVDPANGDVQTVADYLATHSRIQPSGGP